MSWFPAPLRAVASALRNTEALVRPDAIATGRARDRRPVRRADTDAGAVTGAGQR